MYEKIITDNGTILFNKVNGRLGFEECCSEAVGFDINNQFVLLRLLKANKVIEAIELIEEKGNTVIICEMLIN